MVPITDQDWVPRFIPICTAGAMNDHRPSHAIRILQRVVTVVPAVAILQSLEIVGITATGSNGALCHAIHTIGLVGVELSEAMPMNCGAIGFDVISDMDSNVVAPAGFDQWTGIRAIHDFAFRLKVSIWGYCLVLDIKPEFTMNSLGPGFLVVSMDARTTVSNEVSPSVPSHSLVLAEERLGRRSIFQPAVTTIGLIAAFPSLQRRIFALKTWRG